MTGLPQSRCGRQLIYERDKGSNARGSTAAKRWNVSEDLELPGITANEGTQTSRGRGFSVEDDDDDAAAGNSIATICGEKNDKNRRVKIHGVR